MKVTVSVGGSEISAAIREYASMLARETLNPHGRSLDGVEVRLSIDAEASRSSACCELRVAMQPRGAFALSVHASRLLDQAITQALADVDSVLRAERDRARTGAYRGLSVAPGNGSRRKGTWRAA